MYDPNGGYEEDPGGYWYELACGNDTRSIGITNCVTFDSLHDAVMVGSTFGMVTVYDLYSLGIPYVSFKAHPNAVRHIQSVAGNQVLSLSSSHICLHTATGAPVLSSRLSDAEKELTCMQVLDPSRIIIGCNKVTNGNSIYELDLTRMDLRHLSRFRAGSYDYGVQHMLITPTGQVICGDSHGSIGMLDLRSGKRSGMPIKAHGGSVLSMDCMGYTIVSCGNTLDMRPDPFVKIYDARRTVSSVGVIQCNASEVKFVQSSPDLKALFIAASGQFSCYSNVHLASNATLEQMDQISSGGGSITAAAISPVGRAMVLCDSANFVHLWTDDPQWVETPVPNVNLESEPLEPLPEPEPMNIDAFSDPVFWDEPSFRFAEQAMFLGDLPDGSTLSSETLSSGLMEKTLRMRIPKEINPKLLDRAESKGDFVGQYIGTRTDEFIMNHALIFGNETREKAYLHASRDLDDEEKTSELNASGEGAIPEAYQKPKMKMSNIGLSDFDYSQFNQTPFSGLEGTLPNSFANPVLELLYFQGEIRNLLLGIVSDDPSDMATEAGFLFHMLDQALQVSSKNKCCEARNFLRTFRMASDAVALGLLDPTQLEMDKRIGSFTRFIMEQFCRTSAAVKESIMGAFGVHFAYRAKWLTSGLDDITRSSMSLVVDLVYPNEVAKSVATNAPIPSFSFVDLLNATFQQAKKTRLWNKEQSEQLPVLETKTVTTSPPCLLINCASADTRASYMPLWRQQCHKKPQGLFLPEYFIIKSSTTAIGPRIIPVEDNKDPHAALKECGDNRAVLYQLCGVISHISPADHVVAHIRIPPAYAANASKDNISRSRSATSFAGAIDDHDEWLLFNDFAVSPTTAESARDFRMPWKNPCMLMFRNVSTKSEFVESMLEPRTVSEKAFKFPSMATHKSKKPTVTELPFDKLPGKGDLVAIDCEMVALTTEESYINSDGRKVVTEQSQLSLARVSCTTADQVVFIDDYIVTVEAIADYLTRFSGLVPGDLDPSASKHHLVPLRIAYLKLRHLVDRGCIFVGHGLMKDFRVINIFVPPEQIRDTVYLFHMKSSRYLSLSFLASVLLELDIQGKTHDSIEDARTALLLYNEYIKFEADGTLSKKIAEIYEEGRKRNFR